MQNELWFNLCECVLFRLSVPAGGGLAQRLYCGAFEHDRCADPGRRADVSLEIGRFAPDAPAGARTVNKEFVVAPDYLYWRGSHDRGATEIRGIETAPLVIRHVPYRERGVRRFVPGLRAIGMYAEPLLKYVLAQRGAWLVHGGAVGKDGRAVFLAGSNGTHKTPLILDLCRRHGFSFLGDDLVLLANGAAHPAIEHERVLRLRWDAFGRRGSIKLPATRLYRAFARTELAAGEGLRIGTSAPLTGAIILDRVVRGGPGPDVQPLAAGTLWRRVNQLERLEINRYQRRHRQLCNFGRMLMAYEFGVPGSRIFRHCLLEDRSVPAWFEGLPARSAMLPAAFSPPVTDAIAETIARLMQEHVSA